MSLFFGAFLTSSAQEMYAISRNFYLMSDADAATFDAISCIHIARLRIYYGATDVEGEYDTEQGENGMCRVERVRAESSRIILETQAQRNMIERKLESGIDVETYEIIYIQNQN